MKPLIGVSAGFHGFGDYAGVGYQRPLVMAGAVPVILSRVPEGLDDQLDRLAGVMLAAGHDIDPARYGDEPHPLLGDVDAERDAFEVVLVERALARELPILATCRGMQMLNVALGGTLVQDLSLVDAWRAHPSDPTGRLWRAFQEAAMTGAPAPVHPRHAVSTVPGTLLAELIGERIDVDSFHHQAVDRVGRGLVVSARAGDGVIEGSSCPAGSCSACSASCTRSGGSSRGSSASSRRSSRRRRIPPPPRPPARAARGPRGRSQP